MLQHHRQGVGGVCRECLLAEIEEAIATEHPELDREEVFELVQEWLRAVEEGAPGEAGTADDEFGSRDDHAAAKPQFHLPGRVDVMPQLHLLGYPRGLPPFRLCGHLLLAPGVVTSVHTQSFGSMLTLLRTRLVRE